MAAAKKDSKTAPKPLNELLSRSMVDIYVGPSNNHWVLHEKLICHHSPFFRRQFQSSSTSSDESDSPKSFGLPDDDDAAFNAFVGWLYSSAIRPVRAEQDLSTVFELYLLATKFEISALKKDVLDEVREWYRTSDTYPGLRRVQYIYANTEDGDAMRGLLVRCVARMLVLRNRDGTPQHWDKALRKNGQLAVDIISVVQGWGWHGQNVPDVRNGEEGDASQGEVEIKKEGGDGQEGKRVDVKKNLPVRKLNREGSNGKLMKELPNGLTNGAHGGMNGYH